MVKHIRRGSRKFFFALTLTSLSLSACSKRMEEQHHESQKIVVTTPQLRPVTLTQQFVCQIHSQRHIQVRALEMGYLEAISVKEGQRVSEGDLLFTVKPILYESRRDAENAEALLAQLEYNYTKKLFDDKVVSRNEVLLLEAKLAKAQARARLAAAELDFATVKAPFDGIIDRLQLQHGSLVEEGEVLTTLSDNSVMWVYFNVPEARYLEYMTEFGQQMDELQVELVLADYKKFSQVGMIRAIEADFNNQTGNIKFRADFPNPDRLLRHGQTGTIVVSRIQNDAIVIPQRAVFEVLDKRYVYIVDKDDVAHQREIMVHDELEDIYILASGLEVDEKIILEGIREVRDGDKVEYEDQLAEQVAEHLKYHAE